MGVWWGLNDTQTPSASLSLSPSHENKEYNRILFRETVHGEDKDIPIVGEADIPQVFVHILVQQVHRDSAQRGRGGGCQMWAKYLPNLQRAREKNTIKNIPHGAAYLTMF